MCNIIKKTQRDSPKFISTCKSSYKDMFALQTKPGSIVSTALTGRHTWSGNPKVLRECPCSVYEVQQKQQATKIKKQATQHNGPADSIRTVRAAWLSSLRDQASEKGVLRVLLYQFLFNIFIKIVPATEIHL